MLDECNKIPLVQRKTLCYICFQSGEKKVMLSISSFLTNFLSPILLPLLANG